jgi:hypothetical protein
VQCDDRSRRNGGARVRMLREHRAARRRTGDYNALDPELG